MGSLRLYFITRVLLSLPMIFILLVVIFVVLRVMPGDPVLAMLGDKAPLSQIQEMRHQLGIDRPLYVQFFDYLTSLMRGDLGNSLIWGRRPISVEILEHFPATLELTIGSMIIMLLVGVFTGAQSAYKRNSSTDYGFRTFGIVIYSIPIFWFGMILQLLFGVYLGWFPIAGRIDPFLSPPAITGLYTIDSVLAGDILSFVSTIQHLILPSLTLGLVLSGIFTRLTRVNMLDVLRQDFIAAARARGLKESTVLYKHALKNAFIPILTMIGLQFALLLAGAVLTETTFSWPGMGSYLIERINYRDFPAIQGAVVFFAVLVAAVSVAVDMIYAYLDPRIRY
jgi:peptide/nickel transport system permease protein